MTANDSSPSGGKSSGGVSDAERAAYFLLGERVASWQSDALVLGESVMRSLDAERFEFEDLSQLYNLQHELEEIVSVAELLVEDAPHEQKPQRRDVLGGDCSED